MLRVRKFSLLFALPIAAVVAVIAASMETRSAIRLSDSEAALQVGGWPFFADFACSYVDACTDLFPLHCGDRTSSAQCTATLADSVFGERYWCNEPIEGNACWSETQTTCRIRHSCRWEDPECISNTDGVPTLAPSDCYSYPW